MVFVTLVALSVPGVPMASAVGAIIERASPSGHGSCDSCKGGAHDGSSKPRLGCHEAPAGDKDEVAVDDSSRPKPRCRCRADLPVIASKRCGCRHHSSPISILTEPGIPRGTCEPAAPVDFVAATAAVVVALSRPALAPEPPPPALIS